MAALNLTVDTFSGNKLSRCCLLYPAVVELEDTRVLLVVLRLLVLVFAVLAYSGSSGEEQHQHHRLHQLVLREHRR